VADNLTVVAATGTIPIGSPIATEDIGGNHHQRIIAYRDSVRVATTSGGLTTTATAYTAGDQVGTLFTIAGMARTSGFGGYITSVVVKSAATTTGPFNVVFFDSSVTLSGGDNGAWAISDADLLKMVQLVPCSANYNFTNNRFAQSGAVWIPYVCSGGTSLYAGLITPTAIAATPFANATDIQLDVYAELG